MNNNINNSMMDMNDPKAIKIFKSVIEELIRKEIASASFNRMIPAEVKSVALDGSLTVEIMNDEISLAGILNRTGETLIAGNFVYLLKINNSNSNIVATIKK